MQQSIETLTTQVAQMQASIQAISQIHAGWEQLIQRTDRLEDQVLRISSSMDQLKWKMQFVFRMASIAIAIVVPVAGFLGWHYTYKGIVSNVEASVEGRIENDVVHEGNLFYDNLLAGTALYGNSQFGPATVRLKECFKPPHYYDTSLLVPFLSSLYWNDDWDTASYVIDILKKDNAKCEAIRDPFVYVMIGSIEIQGSPEHPEWLESGFHDLTKGRNGMAAGQIDATGQIYINTWVYHLQRGDNSAALADIKIMKDLPVTYSSWRNVSSWKFFKDYFEKNPNMEPQIKEMWNQLPKMI
jgi:hypothetical protein